MSQPLEVAGFEVIISGRFWVIAKAEVMSNLFKPFVTTKGENRNGLGLWVSRDIIARQHGRITIRSSRKPKLHGTVVTIYLPLEPIH